MFIAEIQTRWAGSGDLVEGNHAAWADNFKYGSWRDVTGQEPYADPAVYTIRVMAERDQIEKTEQSERYWVNWSQSTDEPPVGISGIPMEDEQPSQARHDAMRQWQLNSGHSVDFVDATLGSTPAGRSAGRIGETVSVGQKELPPGVPPYPYMLTLEVTRETGWQGALGWKVLLRDWEQDVAPDNTAMAVYAKPDCDVYRFTTGAFVQMEGTYGAVCPPGQEPGDEDIYFVVLYGAAQLACFTMPQGRHRVVFQVNGDASATTRTRASPRTD